MASRTGCWLALLLMSIAALPAHSQVPEPRLQSAALLVEITDSPYSFRVVERATGNVLLAHSRTALNETRDWATALSKVQLGKLSYRQSRHLWRWSGAGHIYIYFSRGLAGDNPRRGCLDCRNL